MDSRPLVTLHWQTLTLWLLHSKNDVTAYRHPPRHSWRLGLPTAPSPGADQMTECFGTCYKHHSHGPDCSITTDHSTHNQLRSCEQGQNFSLPQTSPVNGASDEPSSTPACCICTWPWSSSLAIRKKSSGPSPSLRMDVLWSGPRTSFARRRTLAFSQFNPGPTSNNNSGVNSFWSTQK